jgi:hypothetical protein
MGLCIPIDGHLRRAPLHLVRSQSFCYNGGRPVNHKRPACGFSSNPGDGQASWWYPLDPFWLTEGKDDWKRPEGNRVWVRPWKIESEVARGGAAHNVVERAWNNDEASSFHLVEVQILGDYSKVFRVAIETAPMSREMCIERLLMILLTNLDFNQSECYKPPHIGALVSLFNYPYICSHMRHAASQ